jgi:streptogramin lyase
MRRNHGTTRPGGRRSAEGVVRRRGGSAIACAVLVAALAGVGGSSGAVAKLGSVTEYPLPNGSGVESAIAVGADGQLWFPETFHDQVGVATTKGVVTTVPLPNGSGVFGAALGADGNLWLAAHDSRRITAMSTSGAIVHDYPTGGPQPFGMSDGPDGNLWWTDNQFTPVGKIGTITPSGTITEFSNGAKAVTLS